MLVVRSPTALVMVKDVVVAAAALVAMEVPLVHGVAWSAPLTVMTPTSACVLVVEATVAVCVPGGGLLTQKISDRLEAVVPVSVPGTRMPLTPPRLAVILVAVLATMVTRIIAARLAALVTLTDCA